MGFFLYFGINSNAMPNPEKKPKVPYYKGELLSPGTVPLSESEKTASELKRIGQEKQRSEWKAIPENANAKGINKFQDYLASKGLANLKETQTDEGYNRLIKPELEKFNRENPDLAITPEHIKTLQEYHAALNPKITVDKRYGPTTTMLRYPEPKTATVSTVGSNIKGSQISKFPDVGVSGKPLYEVKTVPNTAFEYAQGQDIMVEPGTGRIIDPSKTYAPGEFAGGVKQKGGYGYKTKPSGEPLTYQDLLNQGQTQATQTSNVTNTTYTGDKNPDILVTDPNIKTYSSTLPAGQGGGGYMEKGLIRSMITPPKTNLPLETEVKANGGIVGRYRKGGLISKLRGYADGGDIPETDPSGKPMLNLPTGNPGSQSSVGGKNMSNVMGTIGDIAGATANSLANNQYSSSGSRIKSLNNSPLNPAIDTATSMGLNAVAPGAGSAYGAIQNIANTYGQVDPETGQFNSKYAAMLSSMNPLKTLADKDRTAGEKALSMIPIYGQISNWQHLNKIEKENAQAIQDAKNRKRMLQNQAADKERQGMMRDEQIQERGFKQGGLVKKLAGGGETEMMINKHNRNHLMRRINEVGHEAAMKEYNEYFSEENKPKQFRIK